MKSETSSRVYEHHGINGDMTNMLREIIELLPSPDLKAKIKETDHQFNENELLRIIYLYAPTFEIRLKMLSEFAEFASDNTKALAKAYIEFEKEKLKRFTEKSDVFVYELHIKETPESFDECYICSSYSDALACIDRFYEKYANVCKKVNEYTGYTITKRKVFSELEAFEEDTYAECVLDGNKSVLKIFDYRHSADCESEIMCSECDKICPYRYDTLLFPNFVKDKDIIKYCDHEGKTVYGICLFNNDDFTDEFFVIPMEAPAVRDHAVGNDSEFNYHVHVNAPDAVIATAEELDEITRRNYFDFIEYLNTRSFEEI